MKIWGDNGGQCDRRRQPRRNIYNTSVVIYEGDRSLSPGQEVVKYAAYAGYTIDVFRYIPFRMTGTPPRRSGPGPTPRSPRW